MAHTRRPRAPVPVPAPPPPKPSELARLMLQIQGLLMELSEVHDQLRQRDLEIERLREELLAMRAAVATRG